MFNLLIFIFKLLLWPFPRAIRNLLVQLAMTRKELGVLHRHQVGRVLLNRTDRISFSILGSLSEKARKIISIIKPETVLGWQKSLTKKFWSFGSNHHKFGRPPVPVGTREFILSMKNENNSWGAGKIKGELEKLGIHLDESTIKRLLIIFRREGKIRNGVTWKKFLTSQAKSLFAMDFLTVDTITNMRFYIFFIICHYSREIVQFAVTQFPSREFVRQQMIQFQESFIQNAKDAIHLIHDGAGEFCIDLSGFGIKGVKISPYAPNMNAIAERFVGSIRREALDWFLLFNEKQVYRIIKDYVEYYNTQRPHQGIGQSIPNGYIPQTKGKIRASPVLGGVHHHYYREAA